MKYLMLAVLLVGCTYCSRSTIQAEESNLTIYQNKGWVRSVWVFSHHDQNGDHSHTVFSFEEEKGRETRNFYLVNIDARLWQGMHASVEIVTKKSPENWCNSAKEYVWRIRSVSQDH